MSYTVTNAAAFKAAIAKQINAAKAKAVGRLAFIMKDVQIHAKAISPTYSGDFASNWNVSYGAPDTNFTSTVPPGLDFGEPRDAPWGDGRFNLKGMKLGQTAYLTNAAKHEEPYAILIEQNLIAFRDRNKDKDRVLGKTTNYMRRKLGVGV